MDVDSFWGRGIIPTTENYLSCWSWLPIKSDEVLMVLIRVNAFLLVDVDPKSGS